MRWRPELTSEFTTTLRRHGAEIATAIVLFASVSLAAGRVWRFPFDDEIYSLRAVERMSVGRLFAFYSTGHDVHPPLAYVLTGVLHALGASEAGMRIVGFCLTALALALFHALALMLAARRRTVTPLTRAIAILLFGLNALAVSQGDALRWYPLFAAEVAVAVTLYIAAANNAARLASAVMLGLAASTNFLAAFVIVPLAIYRYALERRFDRRIDGAMWLAVLLFGGLGVITLIGLIGGHSRLVGPQIANGIVQAVGLDALGFFGGHALGLGQAWMIVPVLVVSLLAARGVIDRRAPGDPAHLLLLLLVAVIVLPLAGFVKPRSFLYLAPVLAAVQALYLGGLTRQRTTAALVLTTALVAPAVAAIAGVASTTHPFKRNAVTPVGEALAVIDANAEGPTLVVSSDPTLAWVLGHARARPERCASYFFTEARCFTGGESYKTVVIVSGYHRWSGDAQFTRRVAERVDALVAGRHKAASVPIGYDADARLKARLSGVPLGDFILTVDVYR